MLYAMAADVELPPFALPVRRPEPHPSPPLRCRCAALSLILTPFALPVRRPQPHPNPPRAAGAPPSA